MAELASKSTLPTPPRTAIELLKKEIATFLSSSQPSVLCIRGKWGVGKTYVWEQYLRANKDKIRNAKYSYVSLFGLDSLDQIKYSIFENAIPKDMIGTEPTVETFLNNLANLHADAGKQAFATAKKYLTAGMQLFSATRGMASGVQQISFLSVKDRLICFDDLERKGKNLRLMDILGLASMLKERRGCKVVLILNDDELGDDGEAFAKYHEKVIDESLVFSPTAEECADIAIVPSAAYAQTFKDSVVSLQISNIRVIKKIERLIAKVLPTLQKLDAQISRQTIQAVTLLGWAHFSQGVEMKGKDIGGKDTDLITFLVTKRRGTARYGARDENLSEDEKKWDSVLQRYGFYHLDDFDLELLTGVKAGFFDDPTIRAHAELMHKKLNDGQINQAWEDSWAKYRGSFDDNAAEVLAEIGKTFVDYIPYATVMDVESVMRVHRRLGCDGEASRLLNLFMDKRQEKRSFYDLGDFLFDSDVRDAELRAVFDAKFNSMYEAKEPKAILLSIYSNQGWNQDDLRVLLSLRTDDWVRLFKSVKGSDLPRIIREALNFGKIQGADTENYKKITATAAEALKKIGKESTINAARVKTIYGIDVDQVAPEGGGDESTERLTP
jgi:hypothetical protein